MALERVLSGIEKELKEKETVKDDLYDDMRTATRLSKQAIFSIHKGKMEQAWKMIKKAKGLLLELDRIPANFYQLRFAGIVSSAHQEFSEANIFFNLVQTGKFVSPKKVGVPSVDYLLGLADVVGELRRRVIDALKDGDLEVAEKSLEEMELIFVALMGMDEAQRFVSELRRKSDIARRIVEATRGDVALEVRRLSLEHSIGKLEKTLGQRSKNQRCTKRR